MVEINSDIDLRSPEFIASRRPVSSAFLKKILVMLCCFLTAGLIYFACSLTGYLERQLYAAHAAVDELREEVEPIYELADQSALLQARANLEQELLESTQPIDKYLLAATQLAQDYSLEPAQVAVDREGNFLLKGRGGNLNDLASFNNRFEELPYIFSAEITALSLCPDGGYLFEFTATGISAKGGNYE